MYKGNWLKFLFIGILAYTSSCVKKKNVPSYTAVLQIGNYDSSFMAENWTCKMLAYDFDKFSPQLNNAFDKLKKKKCFTDPKGDFVLYNSAEKVPTLLEIGVVNVPDWTPLYSEKPECTEDFTYGTAVTTHLNNIKQNWLFKKCSRSNLTQDKTAILDTPACVLPCKVDSVSCYTCSPIASAEVVALKGPGTITCASEFDAKNAVNEHCRLTGQKKCDVSCASGIPEKDIDFPETTGIVSGTTSKASINKKDTFSTDVNATAAFGFNAKSLTGEIGATGSASYVTDYTVNLDSPGPFLWVKNYVNPAELREEAISGATYSCALNEVTLKNVNFNNNTKIGLDLWGIKLNVGGSIKFDKTMSETINHTRSGMNASGKTLEQIVNDCEQWSRKLIAKMSGITDDDKLFSIFTSDGISCKYKEYGDKKYNIPMVHFAFTTDSYASYTADVLYFFEKDSPVYPLSPGNVEKMKAELQKINKIESGWKNIPARNEILVKILNEYMVPASAASGNWALSSCEARAIK